MAKLFVSYTGVFRGSTHMGHVILSNIGPVEDESDVDAICKLVEKSRGWSDGTVVISSFQRLELSITNGVRNDG
jgi:hypothetical protein